MKFKNDFPKNYEWIMNKYIEKEVYYEFECWEHGFPDKTIYRAKTKTASALAKKIDKFVKKLNQ